MTDTATLTKSPALVRGFSRSLSPDVAARAVYLNPLGGVAGRGEAIPAFEVLVRTAPGRVLTTRAERSAVLAWAREEGETVCHAVRRRMAALEGERKPFAGLAMDRPAVMGILNVTPDSFSDGGDHFDPSAAVAAGRAMMEAGADIIDVGGESTRPGAEPVAPAEEAARVVPVIRALAQAGARVSIDTRHAQVMGAAVEAGAAIINDVTALTGDPDSLDVAARSGVPVVVMHMQGEPQTMQAAPTYGMAPLDVFDYLEARVAACMAAGIAREDICVDPGLGFGKTVTHNAQILQRLGLYHGLGCPVLLGISRKSFIGKVSRDEPPKERLAGSVAAAVLGVERGVQIVRVHDVAETAQAFAVYRAAGAAP